MQIDNEDRNDARKQTCSDEKSRVENGMPTAKTDLPEPDINVQPGTDHENDNSPHEGFATFLQAYVNLSRRRNKHMVLQTQAATEASNLEHKRRFVGESIQQLVATFSSQKPEGMKGTPQKTFDDIKAQLIDDGAAMDHQLQVTIDAISRSNSAQFRLAEAEAYIKASLGEVILKLPDGGDLWRDMKAAAANQKDYVSEASEEVPESAQMYFNAAGEASIIQERLIELEQLHVDEEAMRNLERDQEIEPRTPDSIFEERHQSALLALQTRLHETMQTAEAAKKLSDEEGIDIEDWRYRKRRDADEYTPGPNVPAFINSIWPQFSPNGTPSMTPIDIDDDTVGIPRPNVGDWLTNSFDAELPPINPSDEVNSLSKPILSRRDVTRARNHRALRRYRSDTALDIGG